MEASPPPSRRSPFPVGESPFHVKGVLYQGTLSFFENNVRGGAQALFDEVRDPELLRFIQQRFLPSSWYDVLPAPLLIEAEAHAMRLGVEPYLLHRTKWQAARDLGGLYRFVLKLASPEMVIKRLPRVALQMFDFATAHTEVGTKQATGRIQGIPLLLADWLQLSMGVYMETALRHAGAEGVLVETLPRKAEPTQHGTPIVTLGYEVLWR
jgi:hypothetical protein